jgi:O-acetyl-ADP-ribose deacetylase (regulator of RNase III)
LLGSLVKNDPRFVTMEFWANTGGAPTLPELKSPERMDLMERKLTEGKITQEEYDTLMQKENRALSLDTEASGPRVQVILADIEKFSDADVVVNPITGTMVPRNRASSSLFAEGGEQLRSECKRAFSSWDFRSEAECASLPSGSCAMTAGFRLRASRVVHIVTPRLNCQYRSATEHAVGACYTAIMDMLVDSGFDSIALPSLWSTKIDADAVLAYTHVALRSISSLLTPGTKRVYLLARSIEYKELLDSLLEEYFPSEAGESNGGQLLHPSTGFGISAVGRGSDSLASQPLCMAPKAPLLSVWIEGVVDKKVSGESFVAYRIKVVIGSARHAFFLQRRYSEFRSLRTALLAGCKTEDSLRKCIKKLPFPPRVLNSGQTVVKFRSNELELFLQGLVCLQANDPSSRTSGCHIELHSEMLRVLHTFLGADPAAVARRAQETQQTLQAHQRQENQRQKSAPALGEITNTANQAKRSEPRASKSARLHLRAKGGNSTKNEEGNRFITNAQL